MSSRENTAGIIPHLQALVNNPSAGETSFHSIVSASSELDDLISTLNRKMSHLDIMMSAFLRGENMRAALQHIDLFDSSIQAALKKLDAYRDKENLDPNSFMEPLQSNLQKTLVALPKFQNIKEVILAVKPAKGIAGKNGNHAAMVIVDKTVVFHGPDVPGELGALLGLAEDVKDKPGEIQDRHRLLLET